MQVPPSMRKGGRENECDGSRTRGRRGLAADVMARWPVHSLDTATVPTRIAPLRQEFVVDGLHVDKARSYRPGMRVAPGAWAGRVRWTSPSQAVREEVLQQQKTCASPPPRPSFGTITP